MILKKVTIINDNNEEEELEVMDGTFIILENKKNGKILAGVSKNQAINMQLLKTLLQ